MIGRIISRGSSVVERIIGNDEVGSSILPRGTSLNPKSSFQLTNAVFVLRTKQEQLYYN